MLLVLQLAGPRLMIITRAQQCDVCAPTSNNGCDACAAGLHPQHNVPGRPCVECQAWDSITCDMHTGDLLATSETQLANTDTAEECVELVRQSHPTAIGVTYSIDDSNRCTAEFGEVDANNPRNTAATHLKYRSCIFEDIGPARIAARDVTFSATNTFAAEAGEVRPHLLRNGVDRL